MKESNILKTLIDRATTLGYTIEHAMDGDVSFGVHVCKARTMHWNKLHLSH